MRPLKAMVIAAIATLTLGTLAACGNSDERPGHDSMSGTMGDDSSQVGNGPAASTDFNNADVSFAQEMIPHHRQALDMVKLAEGRTLSAKAQAIVAGIAAAQAPEIKTMSGWLRSWGKSVPDASSGKGDMGMDHMSGGSMPGMMSHEQMMDLDAASDGTFEKMWMRMMVAHHDGAIKMAKTEIKSGEYAPAIALAKGIVSGQEKEISEMKALLNQ